MFSVRQKREISDAVQKVLRETNHYELPKDEINFHLRVEGAEYWSWADIRNNGNVPKPGVNPWNEQQDPIKRMAGNGNPVKPKGEEIIYGEENKNGK